MLGLLRDTGPDIGLAPLPNLAQIPALVERACQVGGPVQLRTVGDVRPLPAGTELALYRVVQEALTNVHKHGGIEAPASVTIAYAPGEVVARIENSGRSATATVTVTGGGGHGLIGMRERVTSLGGTLDARQRAEDGFVVTARIPTAL